MKQEQGSFPDARCDTATQTEDNPRVECTLQDDCARETEKVIQNGSATISERETHSECTTQKTVEVEVTPFLEDCKKELSESCPSPTLVEESSSFIEFEELACKQSNENSKPHFYSKDIEELEDQNDDREPLQMIKIDSNNIMSDTYDSEQASLLQEASSEVFLELDRFKKIEISSSVSDSDEYKPLSKLKTRKKRKKSIKLDKAKSASSKEKDKTEKNKSKKKAPKNTSKNKKGNPESDSDGLEDLEEYSKRQNKCRSKPVKPADPYALWCCVCDKHFSSHSECLQHYE